MEEQGREQGLPGVSKGNDICSLYSTTPVSIQNSLTMTIKKIPAPQPGKRLLAECVDSLAASDPSRRFSLIPQSDDVKDGFREVSIHDIARAVNAMSWWMEKHLGTPKQTETFAYMGNNDIRYIIFLLAANKTGNKVWEFVRQSKSFMATMSRHANLV